MRLANEVVRVRKKEYPDNYKHNQQWKINRRHFSNDTNKNHSYANQSWCSKNQTPYKSRLQNGSYFINDLAYNPDVNSYPHPNRLLNVPHIRNSYGRNMIIENNPYSQVNLEMSNEMPQNLYQQNYRDSISRQNNDINLSHKYTNYRQFQSFPYYQYQSQSINPFSNQLNNYFDGSIYPINGNYFQLNHHQNSNHNDFHDSKNIATQPFCYQEQSAYQYATQKYPYISDRQLIINKFNQFLATLRYPEPKEPPQQHYTVLQQIIDALASIIVTYQQTLQHGQLTEIQCDLQMLYSYLSWVMHARICRSQLFNSISLIYQLIFTHQKQQLQVCRPRTIALEVNQLFEEVLFMHIQQNYPSNRNFGQEMMRIKEIDQHGAKLFLSVLCSISNIYLLSMELKCQHHYLIQQNSISYTQNDMRKLLLDTANNQQSDSQFRSFSKLAQQASFEQYNQLCAEQPILKYIHVQIIKKWLFIMNTVCIFQKLFYRQKLLDHQVCNKSINQTNQQEPSIIYSSIQLIDKVRLILQYFSSLLKQKHKVLGNQELIQKVQSQRILLIQAFKKTIYLILQSLFLKIIYKKQPNQTQQIIDTILQIFKSGSIVKAQEIDQWFCNCMLQTFDQFITGSNSEKQQLKQLLFELIKRQINFLLRLKAFENGTKKERRIQLARFLQNIGDLLEINQQILSNSLIFLMGRRPRQEKDNQIQCHRKQKQLVVEDEQIRLQESLVRKLV